MSERIVEGWLCDTEGRRPDMLVITPETYHALRHHRDLADGIMAWLHYSPDDVTEIRVSEARTEVDWLWRVDGVIQFECGQLCERTTIIEANQCSPQR